MAAYSLARIGAGAQPVCWILLAEAADLDAERHLVEAAQAALVLAGARHHEGSTRTSPPVVAVDEADRDRVILC
jgi:hypothetical protein